MAAGAVSSGFERIGNPLLRLHMAMPPGWLPTPFRLRRLRTLGVAATSGLPSSLDRSRVASASPFGKGPERD